MNRTTIPTTKLLAIALSLTILSCGPDDPVEDPDRDNGGGGPDLSLMVEVPGGEFIMGCDAGVPAGCPVDAQPARTVTLSRYYIDRTEVTVAAVRVCVSAGACVEPYIADNHNRDNYGEPGRDNHPINLVSVAEARAYCTWMGKRLPTEAEWEKAARGTDGRLYPWGDSPVPDCDHVIMDDNSSDPPSRAFVGCGANITQAVGARPDGASPYGVHDMMGNLAEWVEDWYDATYYGTGPSEDPPGPQTGSQAVVRGYPSWLSSAVDSTRVNEYFLFDRTASTITGDTLVGFRCAYTP